MATLHGKNAIVYLGATPSGAAVALTEAAEWKIDIDFDEDPDPAFGDTWETRLKGLLRFSGSMSGNMDTAQSLAFDAATTTGSVKWYLYPDRATVARFYSGLIFPKLSVNVPISGKATFSGGFTGDGAITQT